MQTNYEKAYYEAESFWADGALTDEANLRRVDRTIAMVPTEVSSVLDVGCGNGVFGQRLLATRPAVRVVGLDRSNAALKHVKFEKAEGSIDAIPFPDKSFDCVTCLQVMEHLPIDVYRKALSNLARVSRRHVIISVPFQEPLEENTTCCPSCKTTFNIDLHLRSFGLPAMRSLMIEQGGELQEHAFPDAKQRKRYIKGLTMRRARPKFQPFLAPICPLCGYSEGDKTMVAAARAWAPRRPSLRSTIKKLVKTAVDPIWPVETVPGYWIISRYALIAQ